MKRSFLLFVGFLCLQTDVWAHRFGRSHGELCQRVSKIYGGLNNSQLDSAWAKDLPTQKLFEMYNESQGIEIRNAIAERFFSMLEDLAVQMKSKVPSEVEVEDLFVAGLDGLFQSIRDFEPERGVKFETYAAYNVRGRMKDFLREIDWAPRLVRQRETRMKAAKEAFFLSKGRSPDFQELEEALQILAEGEIDKSLDSFVKKTTSKTGVEPTNAVYLAKRQELEAYWAREIPKILDSKDVPKQTSLSKPVETSGKPMLQEHFISDPRIGSRNLPGVLSEVHSGGMKALLLKGLTRSEQMIILLYYYEGMTMKEIGKVVEISESRVSQIHFSLIQRFKAVWQGRHTELED